jgi:peptidoglycan/LPS O-acetylase OafA/YrhL
LAETSKYENHSYCSSKTWIYFGEISFAAYMVHLPVDIVYYKLVDRIIGTPSGVTAIAIGAFAIFLTWIAAAIAHALVEKPARNFMRAHTPSFMRTQTTILST